MQILTEAFKDIEFKVYLNAQRTEWFTAKPLSLTERRKAINESLLESGGDVSVASQLEMEKLLVASVTGWQGMYDVKGDEIPFTKETLLDCCRQDPDLMMSIFVQRLRNIARYGEIDDKKK